jgi:hypothetical protein
LFSSHFSMIILTQLTQLRGLVAGLLPRRPKFKLRVVYVGFYVNEVSHGQVFLHFHCSLLIMPQMIHYMIYNTILIHVFFSRYISVSTVTVQRAGQVQGQMIYFSSRTFSPNMGLTHTLCNAWRGCFLRIKAAVASD